MNPEISDRLEVEQLKGSQAKRAYDQFIRAFIETKRTQLFDIFQDTNIMETEHLLEIKRMLKTLEALEVDIKTIIETGEMASKMMQEKETH